MKRSIKDIHRDLKIVGVSFIIGTLLIGLSVYFTSCNNTPLIAEIDIDLEEEFKKDVTHFEGRRNVIYSVDGILHGGIGHKLTKKELKAWELGETVSDEWIELWFSTDYIATLDGVRKYFPDFYDYPDLIQLALLNFCYQLGPDAPAHFPRATRAIQNREWDIAADNWLYADVKTKRYSKWFHETQSRCLQESERLRHGKGAK